MRKLLMVLFVAALVGLTWSCALAKQDSVGAFQNTKGGVWVERDGASLPAENGTALRRHDLLRTGSDGSAGVILKDNTQFSMGPDTEIVLDEFLFAPREGKLGLCTRMLKGTATYQSGTISKLAPDKVEFKLPRATLGIRGTHFLVKVEAQ